MRKAKRGDPLAIQARDWNKLADIANQFGSQSTAGSRKLNPNCIWVKNTLGRDLRLYAAVCIGYPTPVEFYTGKSDQVFQLINGSVAGRSTYVCGEPVIGILQEPIADGRIGQVQVVGATPAYFRSGEVDPQQTSDWATISDMDDALIFSHTGPIRFLHRNIGLAGSSTWGTDAYRWVLLGGPTPALPTALIRGDYGGTSTVDWTSITGDQRAVGLIGSAGVGGVGNVPAGDLVLTRLGRYHVRIAFSLLWNNPGGGFATLDRCEWRILWPGAEFGGVTPSAWNATTITGERSFVIDVTNLASPQTITLPTVAARRLANATGVLTDLTFQTSSIEVEVIKIAPKQPFNIFWSKDLKDAVFARGATDGPL